MYIWEKKEATFRTIQCLTIEIHRDILILQIVMKIVDAIFSLFDSHHDLICFLSSYLSIPSHLPYYGTFSPILLIHPSESQLFMGVVFWRELRQCHPVRGAKVDSILPLRCGVKARWGNSIVTPSAVVLLNYQQQQFVRLSVSNFNFYILSISFVCASLFNYEVTERISHWHFGRL